MKYYTILRGLWKNLWRGRPVWKYLVDYHCELKTAQYHLIKKYFCAKGFNKDGRYFQISFISLSRTAIVLMESIIPKPFHQTTE